MCFLAVRGQCCTKVMVFARAHRLLGELVGGAIASIARVAWDPVKLDSDLPLLQCFDLVKDALDDRLSRSGCRLDDGSQS